MNGSGEIPIPCHPDPIPCHPDAIPRHPDPILYPETILHTQLYVYCIGKWVTYREMGLLLGNEYLQQKHFIYEQKFPSFGY